MLAQQGEHLPGRGVDAGAGQHGHAELARPGPGRGLVAEQRERFRPRSGEAQPGRGAPGGQFRPLGQETVPGVQHVAARPGGRGDDRVHVEVGRRSRPGQLDRRVGPADVAAGGVVGGVDRHRLDAEHGRRRHDADGDLAPVGDQQPLDHGPVSALSDPPPGASPPRPAPCHAATVRWRLDHVTTPRPDAGSGTSETRANWTFLHSWNLLLTSERYACGAGVPRSHAHSGPPTWPGHPRRIDCIRLSRTATEAASCLTMLSPTGWRRRPRTCRSGNPGHRRGAGTQPRAALRGCRRCRFWRGLFRLRRDGFRFPRGPPGPGRRVSASALAGRAAERRVSASALPVWAPGSGSGLRRGGSGSGAAVQAPVQRSGLRAAIRAPAQAARAQVRWPRAAGARPAGLSHGALGCSTSGPSG